MKKLIFGSLIICLCSSTIQAGIYTGIDLFMNKNTLEFETKGLSSNEVDDNSKGVKLKLGGVISKGWRVQGALGYEKYQDPLFDHTSDDLYQIEAEILRTFDVTPRVLPYLTVGIGTGVMDLDRKLHKDGSIMAYHIQAGIGMFYKITKTLEATMGINAKYRKWGDSEYYSHPDQPTIKTDETTIGFYIGINFFIDKREFVYEWF